MDMELALACAQLVLSARELARRITANGLFALIASQAVIRDS